MGLYFEPAASHAAPHTSAMLASLLHMGCAGLQDHQVTVDSAFCCTCTMASKCVWMPHMARIAVLHRVYHIVIALALVHAASRGILVSEEWELSYDGIEALSRKGKGHVTHQHLSKYAESW